MTTERPASTLPGLEFRRYSAEQARGIRAEVEAIFRGSYVDAIESGEDFEAPEAFMRRFDAYTDPDRQPGFELAVALIDGEPGGQAFGWPLHEGTAWWTGLQLDEGDLAEFTAEDGHRTFALSEIMVRSELTGRGLAHALHDELLTGRTERRATLLVQPDNERAYTTYRKWGWYRVGTLRPSWPAAPNFDVLIHDLGPA
ncbi:GNAT family N-acetyltransferase [Nocardia brasiliensis]|uniref:GNAT family N-acetyltransferase n=1 Tax=Nocardia brasiliensis TaxID=37326 RepID=UPI002456FFB3|nr:GNAT family N-acetyltransferase [Nocardia brasiliensis]